MVAAYKVWCYLYTTKYLALMMTAKLTEIAYLVNRPYNGIKSDFYRATNASFANKLDTR